MYALTRKQAGSYRSLAVSIALAYLAVTSLVSLFHNDLPVGRGEEGEASFPSGTPCPACQFLAGSNSVEAQYEAGPMLVESALPTETIVHSVVRVANACTGSILLRAPPQTSLS